MRTLIATLLATTIAASPVLAQDERDPRSIAVNGSSAVTVVNDTAGFSTGVTEPRGTSSEALRAASLKMRRIIAALRAAGVASGDLRTTNVSVRRATRDGRTVGFKATQSVSVTVRDIEATGEVIGTAVQAGADRISGPRFWASQTGGLYRQALAAALRRARAKAEALAAESGATLGQVLSIAEQGADVVYLKDREAAAPQGAGAVPIRPGRTRVAADLTAVFEIT